MRRFRLRAAVVAIAWVLYGSSLPARPEPLAARWQRELGEARSLILAESWTAAETTGRRLLEELMADLKGGSEAAELVAVATAQLALAEAGLGRRRDALWHLRVAEIFNPALRLTALAAEFPTAGERLDDWRAQATLRAGGPPPATDMRIDHLFPPRILAGNFVVLRASLDQLRLLDPELEVSFVIDPEGTAVEPSVHGRLDNPAPVLLSLELLRDFRFEPARLGAEPIAVLWKLPLPLTQGALRKGVWELKRSSIESLLREQEWQQALDEASALSEALSRGSGPAVADKQTVAAYYISRARAGLEAAEEPDR